MTGREASEVVAVLLAGFPQLTLEQEAFRFWASTIQDLADHDLALTVARGLAVNSTEPPTLASFRDQYRTAALRKSDQQARERGLPEPTAGGVPADVKAWMAERKIGKTL